MLKGICDCFYCPNCFVRSLSRVFAEFMERVIVDFDVDPAFIRTLASRTQHLLHVIIPGIPYSNVYSFVIINSGVSEQLLNGTSAHIRLFSAIH